MKYATGFEARQALWALVLAGSMVCYFLSFVCYYFALKHFPISKVSPVMTVGVVVLVVFFGLFSGETLSSLQILGVICGVSSIFLLLL